MKNYLISCLGAIIIGLAVYGLAQNPPALNTYTVNSHTSTQSQSTGRIPALPHNQAPLMPMPAPNLKAPTEQMPNAFPKSDRQPVEPMPVIPFETPQAR